MLDKEDDDLFDVVPSKDVVPPESKTVLDVAAGTVCRVAYSSQFYRGKIIECGTCNIISPLCVFTILLCIFVKEVLPLYQVHKRLWKNSTKRGMATQEVHSKEHVKVIEIMIM